MQPILAAAKRTTAVITPGEINAAMRKTTSFKTAVFVAAISAFGCAAQIFGLVVRNARHPLFSDVQSGLSVFVLVLSGIITVGYLALAIRKVQQTQTAA
jgi:hypothetical protein